MPGRTQALGGKLTAGLTLPLIGAGNGGDCVCHRLQRCAGERTKVWGLPIDRINEFKSAIQDMAVDVGKAPRPG